MSIVKPFCLSIAIAIMALTSPSSVFADDVDFAKDIQPILAQRCYTCHGEDKDEGGLQLHTPEMISDSETVVGGELDDSDLYASIVLPADDEDFMPKGRDPLTARDADLIRRWIVAGAEMPDTATSESEDDASQAEEVEVPAASEEAIAALRNAGALVMPLASGDNRLSAGFGSRASEIGDEQVALLAGVAEQLVWLDLAGTKVTAAGLAPLAHLKNLTRIHLERTTLGDDALTHLAGLDQLDYLNLYGTQVSDAGLVHLKELKRLKKLYLWQTQASYAAVKELQSTIEGLEANLGHNHPEVVREQLKLRIERAQKAREAAEADEKIAAAAKEAATAQEESATKELAALEPKEAAQPEPQPKAEPEPEAKP